jgi:putative glycosyltransferase
MKLSIVTTLYNSEATVAEFVRRASAGALAITEDYEIVMVDDGSPDGALAVAVALAKTDPRLKVVELSRNFGHHKALMAGMDEAKGDLVFLIDVDLEEPPELLEQFHRQMETEDCDVVFGYQNQRKGGFVESQGGRVAWYLIDKLYSIKIPQNQCTVRLMRREYVDALLLHRESNTVIGGLWVITGFHQVGMPISKGHRERASYTFLRRLAALVNGITSFSTAPLIFMVYMGMIVSLTSFILGLLVILQKVLYRSEVGWSSLIVSIWFIGGIIVICLGVIGTYISRIFIETKNRPYVIVRRIHQRQSE